VVEFSSATAVELAIEREEAAHYKLHCRVCGAVTQDDGHQLECAVPHEAALLTTEYSERSFLPSTHEGGLFRYRSWLPVRHAVAGSDRSLVYRSEGLCKLTGLNNLWIAFHGYWPEKGAHHSTGTFKDLEAFCVLGRLPHAPRKVMVVASAGNTAAAFARACSINDVRCLAIIPKSGLGRLSFQNPQRDCVKIVVLSGEADYSDAIALSERVAQRPNFFLEGGAKNVGRRDGLGTVMLSVFETLGRLPDYYFQAIGSGTGAIAVHDASRRLARGEGHVPSLMLSQNLPFVPIYNAWKSESREWIASDENDGKRQIAAMQARVLSNRRPPYAIRGGLREALQESGGDVFAVDNGELEAAARLYEETEGIDIEPAAAVAFASVLRQRRRGLPPDDSTVVLNITGAGIRRRAQDISLVPTIPDLVIDPRDACNPQILDRIAALCQ
jgi:cysteate synthase